MAGNSKKKTAPKNETAPKKKRDGNADALSDEPQRGERLPQNLDGNSASGGPPPWKVVKDGLIWLVIWSCLFLCFDGCRRVIRYGLPSIRFEWVEPEAKTSLGRWILAERPALLKGDFPAVGRELGETARRLRGGELENMNAAAADTIARVQPEVSDPAQWRTFLSRLGGQLEGGSMEKLAEQYDEAAGYFLPKAVQSLVEAVEVIEDEKVADEIDPPVGDCGGAVGDERPDESEDIPVGGGENSGPLPSAEKEGGTADGTPAGCPGGQCPAPSYSRSFSPYFWPFMSW